MKRIFIDNNILLDFVIKRHSFYKEYKRLFYYCYKRNIKKKIIKTISKKIKRIKNKKKKKKNKKKKKI